MRGSEVQAPGQEQTTQEQVEAPLEVVVTYTDFGFSPREVTVAKDGTATFQNQSSRDMWPASAVHPTHMAYPGSDIEKCGTAEEPRLFDACGPVAPGESWSFVFTEQGSWGYHDHLNVSNTGRIAVQ